MAIKRILSFLTALPESLDSIATFGSPGGACEGMLKLRFAATPSFGVGFANPRNALGQLRAKPDLVTLVGLKIITVVSLKQPQRLNCRLIDCSRDLQAVIALEIRDSRPRIDT